ncbi:RIO1 family-domain-containing protein [Fusarium oxysporum f. sp. albedinis]|uniref:Serine/threonine-protein kinase RIO2 n=7 Tax=Fusarium oxysporum TaxID=5507 RepID=A0A0J9V6S1_FUSO4|nr:atypical/RIO/RIO2 protein kinase [Fusarium oxysporum f. sp. lycopersici 4287]XP_031045249.3 RIO1 family-domain-containing protein [Fusarium oxysporum Fo47]EXA01057.1 Atypical/RIO/RIO2 protein kinase [Fusarium oxysporum f. sp. lycopersici MN25]EXK31732.1 Atypical/RIO/RIO2 protein kinase [Fusarium oxysporum f. sp. melonis 26406]EXL59740.1 Atypical/RIO/RIO2 protein kinase [Fusarium oxysporum f. sp. radicis-lycopersici 26381]KAI3582747.1 RIO1 family-domain-containing protein [Fusarium oxysporum
MKLDTRAMRHLASEDWRVLTAVEMGSKNHELVPTSLIEKISRLRGGAGSVHKSISALAKVGLIARVKEAKYDGYRLTYGGLDYLALHTYAKKKDVYSVGDRIGVGKESDIMVVADHSGTQRVLKIHRLGRISFRTVKSNRDYLKNRQSGSWMYLSRLAAMKEFAFMKALREEGFPVPEPIAQSRHTIVMSLIDAFPLRQIAEVPDPASLYADLIALILRLAKQGLIHGDFNEFNILIKENVTKSEDGEETLTLEPVIIDFPQMISMEHQNAEMYFDRDVNCIKRFFERRFHFVPTEPGPFFRHAKKTVGKDGVKRLDATVEASGFTKRMLKDLEAAIKEKGDQTAQHSGDEDDEDEDDDNDEDEESENSDADNTEYPHDGQVSGGLLGDDAMASKEDMVEDSMSKLTV